MEPYAVYLLHRFNAGESIDQLVATEGIQRDRIVMRLRAALRHAKEAKVGMAPDCPTRSWNERSLRRSAVAS